MRPTDPDSESGQYVAWIPALMRYTSNGWSLYGWAPTWMWNWSLGYSSAVYNSWTRFDNGLRNQGAVTWSNLPRGTYAVYNAMYWYPTSRVGSYQRGAYSAAGDLGTGLTCSI